MKVQWPPVEPPEEDRWWFAGWRKISPLDIAVLGTPTAARMVRVWSRATLDDAHRYYQAAMHATWANWAMDRGEDWSPSDAQLARYVDELFVRAFRLVMSANQMMHWVTRRHSTVPEVPFLKDCRDALVHLDESDVERVAATAVPSADKGQRSRAIRRLPEERLFLGLGRDCMERSSAWWR
jgi:hypothetical protein